MASRMLMLKLSRHYAITLYYTGYVYRTTKFTSVFNDNHSQDQEVFMGVMCDTGANRSNIMSISQYKAYCREHCNIAAVQIPNIDTTVKKVIHGFAGSEETIGKASIVIPISGLGISPVIEFHIIKHNCISILCLREMKNLGLEISIQKHALIKGSKLHKLDVHNGLLWLRWKPVEHIHYTHDELRKLHIAFGHPSARALEAILRRARPNEPGVRDEIEAIIKNCLTCARHSSVPRRFKLTVGTEEHRFNHIVAIDVVKIDGHNVLHCVDESTHFGAASILSSMKSEVVWKALIKCWSLVYLGPPDFLRVDQGSNFVSSEFKSSAFADGITLLKAPVESPETMTHVERYHAPLRAAYLKIKFSTKGLMPREILQLAVKSVNDTTGPEGLCPTLLVFGAIPKPARPGLSPTQLQRAKAVELAINEVAKIHAKTRVAFGLKVKSPRGKERSDLDDLFPGAQVLIYRKKSKLWEGPFIFIDKVGETVCVQMPYGRQIFRSTVVKPAPLKVNHVVDEAYLATNEIDYSESRKKEWKGLQSRKVFDLVRRSVVPEGTRIHKLGWVDEVRTKVDGSKYLKSRCVARNFRDSGATYIPTRSPTVTRWAQRLSLCLAAIVPERNTYVRDISQAYVQSHWKLHRNIYLEPLSEMDIDSKYLLKASKPLYGIPESGLFWFETYHNHHLSNLGMQAAKADPCFFFKKTKGFIPNFVVLQVDDSLGNGESSFLDSEEKEMKFDCKPRTILSRGVSVKFNGTIVSRNQDDSYSMKQSPKLKTEIPTTKDKMVSVRAKFQYIGNCTRPDISGVVQMMAKEVRTPTNDTFKCMKHIAEYCNQSSGEGLTFVKLDRNSLRLLLFTDAAFANNSDLCSQMGYILLLADASNKCNIVHYGSLRCRRVTRSVMAAELLSLVYGFDSAYIVKHTLDSCLKEKIPLHVYTDSRTVFNTIAKTSSTLEKRLQIDAHSLRQSHKNGEITTLAWIPGNINPADGLTRAKLLPETHPLRKVLETNTITCDPLGWTSLQA